MSDNEQLKREFTDDERRRLVDYFSLLIEIDQQEKARYAKLKDSPKGFAMNGGGRQCGLCFKPVHGDIPGWFDKWGFKSDLSRYLRVTHRLRHSYFSMMGPLIL